MDERRADRAVHRKLVGDEAREILRVGRPLYQERFSLLRDTARDALAEPHPATVGAFVPVRARDDEIRSLQQHHRPAVAAEELHRAPEHRVQHDRELECVVHRLPGFEQQLHLPKAVRQRGRQHSLIDQETGELPKVAFLVDRVDAERDAEQHDRDPHHRRAGEMACGARLPGRHEHDAQRDRDQQDRRQDPELQPAALDRLERRRAEITQAGHPGFLLHGLGHSVIRRHSFRLPGKHRSSRDPG